MTREKSVSEAAEKNVTEIWPDVRLMRSVFISGANWSDQNPLPCPKCAKLMERVEKLRVALDKYRDIEKVFDENKIPINEMNRWASKALAADDKLATSMGESK